MEADKTCEVFGRTDYPGTQPYKYSLRVQGARALWIACSSALAHAIHSNGSSSILGNGRRSILSSGSR